MEWVFVFKIKDAQSVLPRVKPLPEKWRAGAAVSSIPGNGAVLLHQPVIAGDILVKKAASFDQIFEDSQAARDDWR